MYSERLHPNWLLFSVMGVSIAIVVAAPFFGMTNTGISLLLDSSDKIAHDIFWKIRLPRVALGFLAGAALGISGMTFQALFRNPLATPYTLGVASGASFGAVSAILLGFSGSILGVTSVSFFGLGGALLATSGVYFFSRLSRRRNVTVMLLAGVAMSFFFSSLILLLQYLSDFTQSFRVVRWLMGGLEVVGFDAPLRLLPFVIVGLSLIHISEPTRPY